MMNIRTNAFDYSRVYEGVRVKIPLGWRIRAGMRSLFRAFRVMDDFDWDYYHLHYHEEVAFSNLFFTTDLSRIDFKFIDHKIYILGDCKPLNVTQRCVLEAICNLPPVASIGEVGVGGGQLTANLRAILGGSIRFSGYDLSEKQLLLFKEYYPHVVREITTGILDLTQSRIRESEKPDVVFASTVLMHIQRPQAYQAALRNFLLSGTRFAVLMDNWNAHDYFHDLIQLTSNLKELKGTRLYTYDSGANIAVAISLKGTALEQPYQPLTNEIALRKYLSLGR